MATIMCGTTYLRPDGRQVPCTFISGHTAEHSWRTLRLEDEQEVVRTSQYDSQVGVLLESIARGDLDFYLEAILAGCHERKRVRRGSWVPGAPR